MTGRPRFGPASGGRSSERVSSDVIAAVADVRGVEPTALPPLYEVVDPEALDRLFEPQRSGTTPDTGRVAFSFAGCEVVVTAADRVTVTKTGANGEGGEADGETRGTHSEREGVNSTREEENTERGGVGRVCDRRSGSDDRLE